ncbi:sensor histidine kinase [Sediminitomix flava]|uniref:histidine kinase n=1 Tax=Sediminitomix flava TaxID=379075 RepID=A0A315ZCZ9_SEDFL|nr:cache domain-containing protein [Sediminitomix flava]PWJ42973.1 phospho-acceptor domain-containing protein [Sediminitomix flava]
MRKYIAQRNEKRSLQDATQRPIVLITLITIVILSTIWGTQEYKKFQNDIVELRLNYLDENKKRVVTVLNHSLKFLQHKKQQNEKILRESLEERIQESYVLIKHIYERFEGKKSREEILEIIKVALGNVEFNEGRGYFFIYGMDGTTVMTQNEGFVEGKSALDIQDKKGKYYIKEMINTCKKYGQGYVQYYVKIPRTPSEKQYPKYSYIKEFKPLNILIGAGEYLDNIISDIQETVLNRFSYQSGLEGNIFVLDKDLRFKLLDNNIYLKPRNDIRFKDIFIANPELSYTVSNFRKMVHQNQGATKYYNSLLYRKDENNELVRTNLYGVYIPEWKWIIGCKSDMADFSTIMLDEKEKLKQQLLYSFLQIGIITLTLMISLWWIINNMTNKIFEEIVEFATFFSTASERKAKIDIENLHFQEFKQLGALANNMIEEREESMKELQQAYNEIQTSEEELRQQSEMLQLTNDHLKSLLTQLKSTQNQLINSEKMASIGQLTAGIAHEINNPINFVTANIEPLKEDIQDLKEVLTVLEQLDKSTDKEKVIQEAIQLAEKAELDVIMPEIRALLDGISEGAERTKEIVAGLRNFARLDREGDFRAIDINEALEATLTILNSKLMRKGLVNVVKEYTPVPLVECLPGKINQVFINLLNNSIDAVSEDTGEIKLITSYDEENELVKIGFRDNGGGIPEPIINKIFDPFFTTKEIGQGKGLGLSISYGIIEQHGGEIQVKSKEGEDSFTCFTVVLPIVQSKLAEKE